ncbi:baseplate J/gp47 family protein [Azospirillum sp. Sh1]|uniref:baseplate assembly protein n=1 Tax=Azospirillum sp. Sh1 TaxID=2607285 RepID=UPI0011EBB01C|nr:baseplate J/gp47 family protein [Azospirillum sp. Sh1]KAA0571073.1 baseplate assembly protein J [Azospirillum sp. Sh1]
MTSSPLPDLPAPQVVETLAYEDIKAEVLSGFLGMAPEFSALLESDPAIKALEAGAYRELLLRHRINQAARANLLAFALGSDLDHLALFYGVERLTGESDDRFRLRIRDRVIGWSTGGGAASYRYNAMSAHADIEDVSVASPKPGLVVVALLPRAGTTATDAVLLDAARSRLNDPTIRVLTDTIDVRMAAPVSFEVAARVWLRPEAPDSRLEDIEAAFRAALAGERRLGWDVTRSWQVAQLQRGGVYRVELDAPAADVAVASDGYARLDHVTLVLSGRSA